MHLKAKPPIFVPQQFRAEIESLSKAALMDLVWDFAESSTTTFSHTSACGRDDAIMKTLRERIDVIQTHRKQAA